MTTLLQQWRIWTLPGVLALACTTSFAADEKPATKAAPKETKVAVDDKLPAYKPVAGVSGSIKSVGSDTMNNLMTLWAEGFKKHYPSVQVEIVGKGSATAPQALIEGAANFGPMSRPMKKEEIAAFKAKFGYEPVQLPTSIDMLAVYVHKDNPLESLTAPQVDAIFSKSRKLGYAEDITSWGQLGLKGEWAEKPISLYGRNAASGTYGYFKEHSLGNGDYKDTVKEQAGSGAVVSGVAGDPFGIGYSGIGYKTPGVKALALAGKSGDPIPASADYAYNGKYPLSRFLLVSINHKPGTELDPLRKEFIKFVFSKDGQDLVLQDGYFPVNSVIADRTLKALGINK